MFRILIFLFCPILLFATEFSARVTKELDGDSVNVMDKEPTTMNIIHFIVEEYKLPKKKAKTLKQRLSRRSKSRPRKKSKHLIY